MAEPQRRARGRLSLLAGTGLAVLVLVMVAVAITAGRGPDTALGGCWYVNNAGAYPGEVAIHLPQCHGANASLQRLVLVRPLNVVRGSEPANAREICQMEIGSGPAGWVGVWADAANFNATQGALALCQLDVTAHGHVRWHNFH